MSFALTFGAVGDFISTAALIVDISRALSETKGSKIECQGLVQDLKTLKTALVQVETLYGSLPQIRELEELLVASKNSMRRCREQIEAFFAEISRYKETLQPAAKRYRVTSVIAKVRWMYDRDKLKRLKEDLMHCCETLNLHLSATANHMIQRHHRETQMKLAELNRLTVDLGARSSSHLTTIESHVAKTYLEVVALTKAQRERIDRPLSEEVFTLHDAVDREAPVPLRLIDCWDAFHAVLTARFRGRPGQRRVSRGKYIISDGILGKDIPRSSDWVASFLPGRLIVMSIICQARQLVEKPVEGNRCPRCTESTDVTVGTERRCSRCRLRYRHLIENEVVEEEPGRTTQPSTPLHFQKPASGNKPIVIRSPDSQTRRNQLSQGSAETLVALAPAGENFSPSIVGAFPYAGTASRFPCNFSSASSMTSSSVSRESSLASFTRVAITRRSPKYHCTIIRGTPVNYEPYTPSPDYSNGAYSQRRTSVSISRH